MSDIVDFICLRIQSELDRYQKTKTIPHDLIEGTFTVDDVESCMTHMSKRHARIAKKLIKDYTETSFENLSSLKHALRIDYASTFNSLQTSSTDFMFPTVLSRYRANINPVRALYYDVREVVNRYNVENERHVWLRELITDRSFNNKLCDAIAVDIKRLERLIKRYYWAVSQMDDSIPLELFHARQMIKDFRHYYQFFTNAREWNADE